MFSGSRALNLLVVTGLLLLMSGTRILCDIGSSLSIDQCCSGVEENGHEKTLLHGAESDHRSFHDDEAAPEKTPVDSKPDRCCSNWYIFTVESADSSFTPAISSLIFPTITGLSVPSQPILSNPAYETANRSVSTANNRAPSSPLYLSIHSYRV